MKYCSEWKTKNHHILDRKTISVFGVVLTDACQLRIGCTVGVLCRWGTARRNRSGGTQETCKTSPYNCEPALWSESASCSTAKSNSRNVSWRRRRGNADVSAERPWKQRGRRNRRMLGLSGSRSPNKHIMQFFSCLLLSENHKLLQHNWLPVNNSICMVYKTYHSCSQISTLAQNKRTH